MVAPVGADVEIVCSSLSNALKSFDYSLEGIRVVEQLKQFPSVFLKDEPLEEDKKILGRMDAGDQFRATVARNDALALLAVSAVRKFRATKFRATHSSEEVPIPEDVPIRRQAYLFRSLKRPEEVTALRRIYASNLIVLGIHSGREQRVQNLAERIAKSRYSAHVQTFRNDAETLVIRDESDERKTYGQRLRSAFAMADIFLDASDPQGARRELDRFLNLLFGKPVITPTPDEAGMAHAHIAAMRSAEMGKQVGAAICDPKGNLIAIGTNEVPKAYGGYHWDAESPDNRDWSRGFDSSDHFKKSSLGELLQVLSSSGMLSDKLKGFSTPEQLREVTPLLKQTRYMQLIEFVRAVHGEMSALMDAAARGVPVSGCTMYVTTFPCHECARHIIAAGIARVVYIEPYAKSLALELHGDSIELDGPATQSKVPFVPFLGIAPRNHSNIFAMPDRKDMDGNVIAWDPVKANPRVSGSFWSYLPYEKEDLKILTEKLKSKGFELS